VGRFRDLFVTYRALWLVISHLDCICVCSHISQQTDELTDHLCECGQPMDTCGSSLAFQSALEVFSFGKSNWRSAL
jgi:hypothetical protein